ncbi:putative E3 ubiquitin-protein ligase [Coemansia sp. RSA 2131]|nr:putative E3 ubiquitin-protein ligase [Coemansia sp. RSA 2131]
MVVSHLFSPLRTLKNRARGKGTGRRGSSGSTSNDGVSSDEHDKPSNVDGTDDRTKSKVTSLCFCCGSKVSYPDTVSCFKCTVCDTINDLTELVRMEKTMEDGQVVARRRVPPPPLTLDRLKAGVQAYRRHPKKHALLEAMIRESFANWDVLNFSFANGKDVTNEEPGILFTEVHAAYKLILALPPPFIRAMMGGIEQILRRPGSFPQESSYHHHISKRILGSLANLPHRVHYSLVLWLSQQNRSSLKRTVQLVNQFISYRVQKYDRARRRNNNNNKLANGGALVPMTTYSAQSTQRELPAFQRTRSNTNALTTAARGTRHNRMRSNTDSRISLTAHRPLPIAEEPPLQQPGANTRRAQNVPVQTENKAPNNMFYPRAGTHASGLAGRTGVLDARSGLGIANLSIKDTPTRFASLGSSQLTSSSYEGQARAPTVPTQMHLRAPGTAGPEYGSRADTGGPAITHIAPPPQAYARESPEVTNIPADSGAEHVRASYFVPLRTGGDTNNGDNGNVTEFRPITSPQGLREGKELNQKGREQIYQEGGMYGSRESLRVRAASMSAGELIARDSDESDEEEKQTDAVRAARGSVLGVLDGTVEPSNTSGRCSLTRTRSSSEAPMRAREPRADNIVAAAPQMAGEWGAGVDMDDCYVGADGVFYPKSNILVMHQHDWRLVTAAKVMALLHAANLLVSSRARLPLSVFCNAAIDNMDLIADYDAWQARIPGAFSFCQYPFLLSLRAKVQIMQVDAARQMNSKLKEAVISALFQNYHARRAPANQPHLKLLIRRRCLVEDSLHQLATHEQDLKKRLKIEFVGEEGVDAGGLTKEWFMLLLRELMNPMYGMFTCEADGAYWFNPAALETSNQFFLVGVVVGLALYNSTILDLHLPLAVFKKLLRTGFYQASAPGMTAAKSADAISLAIVAGNQGLGTATATAPNLGNGVRLASGAGSALASAAAAAVSGGQNGAQKKMKPAYAPCYGPSGASAVAAESPPPVYGLLSPSAQLRYQISEMLTDVAQIRPHLARGLRQLLQYREDDVEDVFCLTFEASYDAYGDVVTMPLVANGANVAVTSANRVEYVLRYLQWVLNDSIARQFEPFRRGFYYVCGSNALSLFKPEEIELMVHGSGEDWDSDALRKTTNFVGFDTDAAQTVGGWFWDVLREMTQRDRKLFLAFVTGSDRMPTVASTQFSMKLAMLGSEHDRLPTAHTCFNQLGLWMYRSKDELRQKLMMAMTESEGFGLK